MKTTNSVGKVIVLENSDPIAEETQRIQDQIRERAFALSQTRGHSGRDMDDWLSAESEIISVPPTEVIERNGTYEIHCAIAGINPADVNVMAAPDQILIKCDFRHDHMSNGTVLLCDFRSATVFRPIQLPHRIDTRGLRVGLEEGMLHISADRAREQTAEPAQPKRVGARKTPAKKLKKTLRNLRT